MSSETHDLMTSGENGKPGAKLIPTPGETTHPEHVDPAHIRLFREPAWMLRMTIEGDRSYLKVKIVRAAPLSSPSQYICFLDGRDEVICMVKTLDDLDEPSRRIVHEELDQRYLTAVIERVDSVRSDFGVSYWDVQTSRGRREFVVQNVSESAQWLGDRRLVLTDVDANRFEIPDVDALDKRSIGLIEQVL